MSAAEIIEQIKQLPPDGQREIRLYLDNVSKSGERPAQARYIPDETFQRAAAKVFEENKELLRRLAE